MKATMGKAPGPRGPVDQGAKVVRERSIEAFLVARVRALGGLCIKFTPAGDRGWPDRVVLLPGGLIGFAELKRPGKKPTLLQLERLKQLRLLGFVAEWVDSFGSVELFLNDLCPGDYLDRPFPVPA